MIKIWYDNALCAVMAKYGDDTFKMLDKEDNKKRSELLRPASEIGFKDGGNWVTPYSEKLWSEIKGIGTLLTIRVEYQMRFQATFFFYDGLGVKISDDKLCNQTDGIFQKIEELGVPTPGTSSTTVPYSQELWDAILVVGERIG